MRLVEGVGINLESMRGKEKGVTLKLYNHWANMLERCYSNRHRRTYADCSVDPQFHVFQDFTRWAKQQIGHEIEGFQLDKDILKKGNKVYAPETCCFVPKEINLLFPSNQYARGECPIGVYKSTRKKPGFVSRCSVNGLQRWLGMHDTPELAFLAYKVKKEEIIKAMAVKHQAVIEPRVFEAMLAYTVEITD